ncbi:MAG TPA: phage protease [Bellilinea sp.]|nr:phage protease [Bellilinea sp.]
MFGTSRAPNWVNLLPPGPDLVARDGRRWTYDPAVVIAAFASNKGPLPVDYEHAQDILAPKGEIAPAAGWIIGMAERGGALWGKVEWTERAAQQIASREYLFISASMRLDTSGRIVRLVGAGLVNRPALPVAPLMLRPTDLEAGQQAAALARQATAYQAAQAALGRCITIMEAVETVASQTPIH